MCVGLVAVLGLALACDRGAPEPDGEPAAVADEPAIAATREAEPGPGSAPTHESPSPSPSPSEADPTTPDTPAPAPVPETPETMAELYVDGMFRSEGGRVLLAIPEAIADKGKVERSFSGRNRMLTIEPEGGGAQVFVEVFPPGDYDSLAKAQQLRAKIAKSMAASVDLDALALATTDQQGPGGHVYGFRHGPGDTGAVATVVLVADGDAAVMLLAIGREQVADSMVASLLPGIRARDLAPSERFEGTYASKPKAVDGALEADWVRFDRRGYAYLGSPRDALATDTAASVQAAAFGLRKRVYTYAYADGQLVLTPLVAGERTRTLPVTRAGAGLTLDGKPYTRVDGVIADGTRFEGRWQWYTGSSVTSFDGSIMTFSSKKTFTFGPGDAISFRGDANFIGNTVDGVGMIDSTLSAFVDDGAWSGRYAIVGGELRVETAEGLKFARPIFAVPFGSGTSDTAVAIGGLIYNKQ